MSETTMSETAMSEAAGSDALTDETDAHGHDDHHPTEKQYWIIFAVLAVLTAVEVAWSFMGLSGPALVIPLIIMMIVKFFLVAGVFMHLYFDFKAVNGKYFSWAFGGAIVLAMALYFVVFATFEFEISYFN